MDGKEYYEIAQSLEKLNYWKEMLPKDCHERLVAHLKTPESWNVFFTLSKSIKEENEETEKKTVALKENETTTRRKFLGDDGLLSLRIRVLLLDATFYSSAFLSDRMGSQDTKDKYFYDDMYYTLECDHEDFAVQPIPPTVPPAPGTSTTIIEIDGIQDKTSYGVDPIDKNGQGAQGPKKISLNTSREIRNLLGEPKIQKSWSKSNIEGFEELYTALDDTMTKLMKNEDSAPFRQRVRKCDAHDYHTIIKKPIDLSLMTKKIRKHEYNSKKEFQEDLDLMFANCRKYNTEPKSIYVKHASALDKYAKGLMKKIRDIDCVPPEAKASPRSRKKSKKSNSLPLLNESIGSTDEESSPSVKRRPRGRGRPKKIKVPEVIDLQTSSSSVATPLIPKSEEAINISTQSKNENVESNEGARSVYATSLAEFLEEDPQIRSWRLSFVSSRLERIKNHQQRISSSFSSWPAFERDPLAMKEYQEYYQSTQRVSYLSAISRFPRNPAVEGLALPPTSRNHRMAVQAPKPRSAIHFPEHHMVDSVPELPILAPHEIGKDRPYTKRMTNNQAFLALQKALAVILAQSGYHGVHKIPFEVLSDLFASFFVNIGRTIQLNSLSGHADIMDVVVKAMKLGDEKKGSLEGLMEYSKVGSKKDGSNIEKEIYSSPLYAHSSTREESPDEMVIEDSGRVHVNVSGLSVSHNALAPDMAYSFHPSEIEEPVRKKVKVATPETPRKKKRGRPKKKRSMDD